MAPNWNLFNGEAARTHADRFARWGHPYQEPTAAMLEKGRQVSDTALARARARASCLTLRQRLHDHMDQHGLDLNPRPTSPAGGDGGGGAFEPDGGHRRW